MTDVLDDLRAELLALGSATLYEASGRNLFLPAEIRPSWPGARLVGRALPVRAAAGDNLPLHLALAEAHTGEVLVVDAGASQHGYWGEVLTVAAQCRGVAGLVIDGGVRDLDRLEALDFPVFSSWIALQGTVKDDAGRIGDPIRIGGTRVARGDVVVADRDGVVVLPADLLHDILRSARARAEKESGYLEQLRGGALTVDLLGLR